MLCKIWRCFQSQADGASVLEKRYGLKQRQNSSHNKIQQNSTRYHKIQQTQENPQESAGIFSHSFDEAEIDKFTNSHDWKIKQDQARSSKIKTSRHDHHQVPCLALFLRRSISTLSTASLWNCVPCSCSNVCLEVKKHLKKPKV